MSKCCDNSCSCDDGKDTSIGCCGGGTDNDCCCQKGCDCDSSKDCCGGKTESNCCQENLLDSDASNMRGVVKEQYSRIAKNESRCSGACNCNASCDSKEKLDEYALLLGYTLEDLQLTDASGGNLGLGCGNPIALATLKPGEVVLDLGSGAGFDCILASRKVGSEGKVIGVDMTQDMIDRARENITHHKITNVTFEYSQIENLPLPDASVDVVISNCVVNLSPEKHKVLSEAFRVLKKGGRLCIADVVATSEMPECIRNDVSMYTGCISGAVAIPVLEGMLRTAGFSAVRIDVKADSKSYIGQWAPGTHIEDYVASAQIYAEK